MSTIESTQTELIEALKRHIKLLEDKDKTSQEHISMLKDVNKLLQQKINLLEGKEC